MGAAHLLRSQILACSDDLRLLSDLLICDPGILLVTSFLRVIQAVAVSGIRVWIIRITTPGLWGLLAGRTEDSQLTLDLAVGDRGEAFESQLDGPLGKGGAGVRDLVLAADDIGDVSAGRSGNAENQGDHETGG